MLVLQVAGPAPTIKARSARGVMLPPPGWLDPTRTTAFVGGRLLQPSFICTTSTERAQAHLDPAAQPRTLTGAAAVRPACAHKVLKGGKGSGYLVIPTTINIEN